MSGSNDAVKESRPLKSSGTQPGNQRHLESAEVHCLEPSIEKEIDPITTCISAGNGECGSGEGGDGVNKKQIVVKMAKSEVISMAKSQYSADSMRHDAVVDAIPFGALGPGVPAFGPGVPEFLKNVMFKKDEEKTEMSNEGGIQGVKTVPEIIQVQAAATGAAKTPMSYDDSDDDDAPLALKVKIPAQKQEKKPAADSESGDDDEVPESIQVQAAATEARDKKEMMLLLSPILEHIGAVDTKVGAVRAGSMSVRANEESQKARSQHESEENQKQKPESGSVSSKDDGDEGRTTITDDDVVASLLASNKKGPALDESDDVAPLVGNAENSNSSGKGSSAPRAKASKGSSKTLNAHINGNWEKDESGKRKWVNPGAVLGDKVVPAAKNPMSYDDSDDDDAPLASKIKIPAQKQEKKPAADSRSGDDKAAHEGNTNKRASEEAQKARSKDESEESRRRLDGNSDRKKEVVVDSVNNASSKQANVNDEAFLKLVKQGEASVYGRWGEEVRPKEGRQKQFLTKEDVRQKQLLTKGLLAVAQHRQENETTSSDGRKTAREEEKEEGGREKKSKGMEKEEESAQQQKTMSEKGPYGKEVLHRKLKIHWPREKKWYQGVIDKYNPSNGQHHVTYSDGDRAWYDLSEEMLKWVDVVPGAAMRKEKESGQPHKATRANEEMLYQQDVVNRRVMIYWSYYKKYYEGVVDKYNSRTGQHHVTYADDDKSWHYLSEEKLKWVDEEPPDKILADAVSMEKEVRESTTKRRRVVASESDSEIPSDSESRTSNAHKKSEGNVSLKRPKLDDEAKECIKMTQRSQIGASSYSDSAYFDCDAPCEGDFGAMNSRATSVISKKEKKRDSICRSDVINLDSDDDDNEILREVRQAVSSPEDNGCYFGDNDRVVEAAKPLVMSMAVFQRISDIQTTVNDQIQSVLPWIGPDPRELRMHQIMEFRNSGMTSHLLADWERKDADLVAKGQEYAGASVFQKRFGDQDAFLMPYTGLGHYNSHGRFFTQSRVMELVCNHLKQMSLVSEHDHFIDFSAGSNEFAPMLSSKTSCTFQGFDLFPAKFRQNFTKKDWFTVTATDVSKEGQGKEVVLGLNPPFGFNNNKSRQFVSHGIKTFRPRLLVLIAPNLGNMQELRDNYKVVHRDERLCSGKDFYIPGAHSIGANHKTDTNPEFVIYERISRGGGGADVPSYVASHEHRSSLMPAPTLVPHQPAVSGHIPRDARAVQSAASAHIPRDPRRAALETDTGSSAQANSQAAQIPRDPRRSVLPPPPATPPSRPPPANMDPRIGGAGTAGSCR